MIALLSILLFVLQPYQQYPATSGIKGQEGEHEPYYGNGVVLLCVPSEHQVYTGEPVTVSYKLLTGTSVQGAKVISAPSFRGLSAEEISRPGVAKRERYKGRDYTVTYLKKTILTPYRPGKLVLDPLTVLVNVELPPDPDDFFQVEKYREYVLSSGKVELEVVALPNPMQGLPEAIGQFSFSTSVEKNEVTLGEVINYRVLIAGIGNSKAITPPGLNLPPQIEVYEPTAKVDRKLTAAGPASKHVYEYRLVPSDTGLFVMPVLRFRFFDPRKGKYITLSSVKHEIRVKAGQQHMEGAGENGRAAPSKSSSNKGLIVQDRGTLVKRGDGFFGSYTFFIVFTLSLILYGVAYTYTHHLNKIKASPLLLRRRRALKTAKKRIESLNQETSDLAFSQLGTTILAYLSDRLQVTITTSKEAKQELLNHQVPMPIIDQLQEVLWRCYEASFSRAGRTANIQQLSHHTEILLKTIEKATK